MRNDVSNCHHVYVLEDRTIARVTDRLMEQSQVMIVIVLMSWETFFLDDSAAPTGVSSAEHLY